MLRTRIVLAVAILVPLMTLVHADFRWHFGAPGAWLFPLGFAISLLAMMELHALAGSSIPRPRLSVCLAGVFLVFVASALPVYWPWFGATYPAACPLGLFGLAVSGLLAAVGLGFVVEMRAYQTPTAQVVPRLGFLALALVYLTLPMVFLMALRLFAENAWGLIALSSLIIVVKLADVGAYAVGKSVGRHKMAPRLSPNKTVEGAVGSVIAAIGAAVGCGQMLVPLMIPEPARPTESQILGWIAFGTVVSLAGMVGDLAESLLKRDSARKDSSQWLPGLGGALDVMDSLLFAAPVAYVFWLAGWIGPGPL